MQENVAATRLSVPDIPLDNLRHMHAYWQSRHVADRLPGRRDIDPVDFPWALGLVCLLDVTYEPLRFRYRLDGSLIADRHGQDFTGRTTDEVRPSSYAQLLRRHFSEVANTRRPSAYRIVIHNGMFGEAYVRLALPLATDGATVDMILTMSDRLETAAERPQLGDKQLLR